MTRFLRGGMENSARVWYNSRTFCDLKDDT